MDQCYGEILKHVAFPSSSARKGYANVAINMCVCELREVVCELRARCGFGVQARQGVKVVISKISKISRRRTDVYLSSGGDALSHHLLHYNIHLLVKTSYYMTWGFDELTYYFIIVYIKFENIF